MASSIHDWFLYSRSSEFLAKLKSSGVHPVAEARAKVSQALEGKTFVLTGALSSITRDEAKRRIRDRGGDISESVSSKTDYVVVGEEPGSKFERARELGVKTITEKEFLKLLG